MRSILLIFLVCSLASAQLTITTIPQRRVNASGGDGSSAVASDNFNRADESPLGTNWTQSGDFNLRLLSNAVATDPAIGGYNYTYWSGSGTFATNQYAQVKVVAGNTSEWLGVSVRGSSGNMYYVMCSIGSGAEFGKIVSNTQTIFSSAGASVSANDVIKITVSGTTVTWYINGVQQEQVTDSSLSSGVGGLCGYGGASTATIDDWEAGNL